jgi:hypothetical protein
MTSVQIPEILFILVTVLLVFILIGVLIVVILFIKIVQDVRSVTETAHEISAEIKSKTFVEILKDVEFRSHIMSKIKDSIIKLIPFVATVAAFLLSQKQRKIKRPKK